jgi:hypothetical protein
MVTETQERGILDAMVREDECAGWRDVFNGSISAATRFFLHVSLPSKR